MGKGNVSVHGPYEAVYYISNSFLHVYREDEPYKEEPEVRLLNDIPCCELDTCRWLFDEEGSMNEEADVLECIVDTLGHRFRSMTPVLGEKWVSRTQRVIMENELFAIAVEDNENSLAVELLQKEVKYDERILSFQKRHFERYRDALRDAMLERVPEISFPTSAWTSGTIRAEDFIKKGE